LPSVKESALVMSVLERTFAEPGIAPCPLDAPNPDMADENLTKKKAARRRLSISA
jgi:hypothetical protein